MLKRQSFIFFSRSLFVAGILLLLVSGSALADEYTITDLGTLGGIRSGAGDLNDQGQIVGLSTVYSGAQHGFFWDGDNMNDLGTPEGYLVSGATAVNAAGQIVGYTNGEYQSQYAYLWESGNWSYLGTLAELDYSVASDINNSQQIIGYSFMLGSEGGFLGWIWEDGNLSGLGTLGGDNSSANAINELGEIVGYAQIYDPEASINHACLWTDGDIIDLGVLPGEVTSAANDINENGQICGSSSHQQPVYPFLTSTLPCLWGEEGVIEINLLAGYVKGVATGINNNGQVVGWMSTSNSGGNARAFIWENGFMFDLNVLVSDGGGWTLETASAINDAGQIVGSGEAPNGQTHGYLLTPIITGAPEVEDNIPSAFLISQNYPNPFNASTTIRYELPEQGRVKLDIYDAIGRKLTTLEDGLQPVGSHQVLWKADDAASGVYFYKLQMGGHSDTKKMLLVK